MPITTDLNVSPYFDDYDESKDYYKILFRPGVAVQVRELNQLQTILQKQVERFGDNIYKRGTIIDGCQFVFHETFPYIKIKDTTTEGALIDVSNYNGKFVKDPTSNLQAYIITSVQGLEEADPDLNTLYLKYVNSGDDNITEAFPTNRILTVYDGNNSIESVTIDGGSLNFSNGDTVVFLSALAVQNATGGTTFATPFQNNEVIEQTYTGAKATIVEVNATANAECLVLKIKPLGTDLAAANSTGWDFATGFNITGNTSSATGNTAALIGSGASATIETDAVSGEIVTVTVVDGGTGYYVPPHVTVSTTSATTSDIAALSLTGRNYIDKVTTATVTNAIGSGYGFTVTDGVIYQKGYFTRVGQQLVVVEKYSPSPNNKVIGFDTIESIVNANADETLLDNATGSPNRNAPGANRLQLTPTLVVLEQEEADANDEFFGIVSFNSGQPFKLNRSTSFNAIAQEMAKRTFDESGNYVVDPFLIGTKSTTPFASEVSYFDLQIDPGVGYIDGYRVETARNYNVQLDKATDYVQSNTVVSINYGNFLRIQEVTGPFNFASGGTVDLYNQATYYLSNTATGGTLTPAGSIIGRARARSITYESGEPGTPDAKYRLYLFDVNMDPGKNFRDVRTVASNTASTVVALADVVRDVDGTTGNPVADIKQPSRTAMTFYAGSRALKQANTITYRYRSVNSSINFTPTGNGVITLTNPNEAWGYAGDLSANELEELILFPRSRVVFTNTSGTVGVTTSQSNLVGTGTAFVTDFNPGDYVYLQNTTGYAETKRIVSITNSTLLTVNSTFTKTESDIKVALVFPNSIPIPLSTRLDRSANVNGADLRIYLDTPATASGADQPITVVHNVDFTLNPAEVTKTVNRRQLVKIQCNTATTNTAGPWCLGVPDIFRLRNVYVGDSTVNTASTTITNHFYIDHNQNQDFYDLGYLYKKPKSTYTIGADSVLLVEYDCFTHNFDYGLKQLASYPVDDSKTLTYSNTTINLLEVPEFYSQRGVYYDLRNQFDFRPLTVNTVAITNSVSLAPVNPAEPAYSSRFSATAKKFPAPESDITAVVQTYLPRVDAVTITSNGDFKVVKGVAAQSPKPPPTPASSLIINYLNIPAYPSLPFALSESMTDIIDTGVVSERYTTRRVSDFTILAPVSASQVARVQPRRYTMEDIGKLDRRIADLEYYVALSQVEANVKDKPIASSNDPSVNRFKFGFFVDNFTTTSFSDMGNPSYNATIFKNELTAKKDQLNFKLKFYSSNTTTDQSLSGQKALLTYGEEILVKQLNATNGTTPANTGTVTTPVIVQTQVCVNVLNKITTYRANGSITETSSFTLSSLDGACAIYYDVFQGLDIIEVHQSTTQSFTPSLTTLLTSSSDAVVLTTSDRDTLTRNRVFVDTSFRTGPWTTANRPDMTLVTQNSLLWTRNAGKITWTHNASLGQYYKIVVKKGSANFSYRFCYPVDTVSNIGSNTSPNPVVPIYSGTFITKDPATMTLQFKTSSQLDLSSGQVYDAGTGGATTGATPTTTSDGSVSTITTTTSTTTTQTEQTIQDDVEPRSGLLQTRFIF